MLQINAVKAFQDNYLWVIHATGDTRACVVDPGDAEPVLAFLEQQGLQLEAIFTTHHHADHIGGIDTLLACHPVPVYGPATPRIPQVTIAVAEGDSVTICGQRFAVLAVPGHTRDHLAYISQDAVTPAGPALFCGDTLFAGGCGRMFEGTPPVMHSSLRKLAALPATTQVYCAHEYTLANLRFAQAVMPGNSALEQRIARDTATRQRDEATVPSSIGLELATNPFLRCQDPEVIAAVSAQQPTAAHDGATVFGLLRAWKDRF